MTVFEAIESRRSIRKFLQKPIEPEKLEKIAEAFRLSPSAGNGQNWKLYVVKTDALREKIRKVCLREPSFVTEAPVMLIFCGLKQSVMTNGHRVDSVDVSIGAAYAILEAWELGLGS
ncbi:MAG: nitroreductase family protein, partial [Christensenellaceae bacterium]|nr:nitroreductase family protein [Christensenellaceae bacterium]